MSKNLAEVLSPSPLDLVNRIINACNDANGQDIKVLDVAQLFGLSDYFVIVSGRSDRQVLGITSKVLEELAKIGIEPSNLEGTEQGHWILLDLGDVVLHVFYEPVRQHYDLEGLWAQAKQLDLKTTKRDFGLELRAA